MKRPALLFIIVLVGCANLRVVPLPPEAEHHRATTDDGWQLELTRYRAQGTPKGPPVLLCHGISANARNMDLDDQHSLARWLAAQGRDAWTLSFRGAGESDDVDEAKGRKPITFDDYWRHDLPAAIAWVQKTSGATKVDAMGHSMGGMVMYAYLSQGGSDLNTVVTLGSPTRLDWGTGLERWLRAASKIVTPGLTVPSVLGAHLAAPFETWLDDSPLQRFFYNPESTRPETWQRLISYGTANVAGAVALQLLALVETGDFKSSDGRDLRAGLAHVTTPVLVVAAKLDRVALTPAVHDGYRALGGPKEWLLITRANGSRGEYGHMDLVIGERAAFEVWSKALTFLNQHLPPPHSEP